MCLDHYIQWLKPVIPKGEHSRIFVDGGYTFWSPSQVLNLVVECWEKGNTS